MWVSWGSWQTWQPWWWPGSRRVALEVWRVGRWGWCRPGRLGARRRAGRLNRRRPPPAAADEASSCELVVCECWDRTDQTAIAAEKVFAAFILRGAPRHHLFCCSREILARATASKAGDESRERWIIAPQFNVREHSHSIICWEIQMQRNYCETGEFCVYLDIYDHMTAHEGRN